MLTIFRGVQEEEQYLDDSDSTVTHKHGRPCRHAVTGGRSHQIPVRLLIIVGTT
jgi:hypothetical protein